MFDIISKLIPPPLLLGVLIWGLVCAIWLQPAVEKRMAERFVAQCEAGELPEVSAPRPIPSSATPPNVSMPQSAVEVPLSIQIISELRGLLRDGGRATPLPYQVGRSDCEIAVDNALAELFWPNLFHVMSLRHYSPRPLQHADQYVARQLASLTGGAQR